MDKANETDVMRRVVWAGALVAATAISSFMLACATPFSALGALAVLFMPRRDALWLIGGNFLLNQAVGFGLLHWPQTADCVLGGLRIGVACFAAAGVGLLVERLLRERPTWRAVTVFLTTFVAFELVIVTTMGSQWHENDELQTYLYLFYVNGIAFAGLLALQGVAVATGFSRWPLPTVRAQRCTVQPR